MSASVLLLTLALLACDTEPIQATPTEATPQVAPATPAAPASDYLAQLKARHAQEGTTPEGALKVWFDVLLQVADGAATDHEDALAFLTLPLKEDPDWRSRESGQFFLRRVRENPHIIRSYAQGSSPENGYTMPDGWTLAVQRVEAVGERGTAVFVTSSGADNPRPIYMKRSTQSGLWYVSEFGNVYVGIRPIVDPNAETFE